MRCTCQKCGTYMVQDERGLESCCICPDCFNTCSACMGTPQGPASREELAQLLLERERLDRIREDAED